MQAAQQGPSFSTRLPPSAQTAYYSGAALRCGLGGLVTVSSGNYHVCMRGARLPELREFIKVPHKQPPAEVRWAGRQCSVGLPRRAAPEQSAWLRSG